jgi:hypothetical protein
LVDVVIDPFNLIYLFHLYSFRDTETITRSEIDVWHYSKKLKLERKEWQGGPAGKYRILGSQASGHRAFNHVISTFLDS